MNDFILIEFVDLLAVESIRGVLIGLGFRYELKLNAHFADRVVSRGVLLSASTRAHHAAIRQISQVLRVQRIHFMPLYYFLQRVDIFEQLANFQIHIAQVPNVVLFPFTLQLKFDRENVIFNGRGDVRRCRCLRQAAAQRFDLLLYVERFHINVEWLVRYLQQAKLLILLCYLRLK